MKPKFPAAMILLMIILYAGCSSHKNMKKTTPEYRNFYGISWAGTPHENLMYANQMGYDYVFYQKGMEEDTLSNGLRFYLETPEYTVYSKKIDLQKTYSTEQIRFFETHCALKDSSVSFPDNIARGWYTNPHLFTTQLDFQQQKIIDWAIDSILKNVAAIEARNPAFRFGGFAWDVPQPAGDFWDTIQHPGRQITLAYWTGGDFGYRGPGVTHEYNTYSDGLVAYYKQLYRTTREKYPDARFMMEPYRVYESWIAHIENRDDARDVMPDILSQEKEGVEFAKDERIFRTGLITKDRVISTTPNCFKEADNRLIAASAALNGSWFSWYGRFGGTGDMPRYQSITEVPPRLKLIRVLTLWENLNHTPLAERTWDGTLYESPTAMASPGLIAALQPGTNKLFVVFLTPEGRLQIPEGKEITDIYRTNDFFIEDGDGHQDLETGAGVLRIRSGQFAGQGYIIHLKNN